MRRGFEAVVRFFGELRLFVFMMWFLEISCESESGLDVAVLGHLVTACEQNDEFAISLGVLDAVARSDINLKFGHTLSEGAVRAGIPVGQEVDSKLDSSTRLVVTQTVDPIPICHGHSDTHHFKCSL